MALAMMGDAGRLSGQASSDPNAALMKKVEELEKSLAALRAEIGARNTVGSEEFRTVAPTPPPVAKAAPPASIAAVVSSDDSADNHVLGPLEFRGYGDFGYGRAPFEKLGPTGLAGSTHSFTLGDFDLFVNSRISDRLSVLGEVLVTSDFSNSFGSEIDRLMLTYRFNKYLRVSAGKYNTAIGFYTNEFHRARFFQTATSKPLLFADEDNGGILPVHSIGLTATGEIPSGTLGLHWVAEVANGRGWQDPGAVPVQNFVDENNGKAFNLALYARPEAVHGLDVGASFYRDRLHPGGLSAIEQRIYSAHAALIQPHLELIAEGVLLQHSLAKTSQDFNTVSAYTEASYLVKQLRPYFRYEYQRIPAADPVIGILGRLNGPSAGIRYDLSDFSCIKFQYGLLSSRSARTGNDFQAQLAFAF